jgi:hypothetical protein
MIEYPVCRHVKANGLQCQAPALTHKQYCYFHHRVHKRHAQFRPTEANREYFTLGRSFELGVIEDREAVQFALSVVINALATNSIETKRAAVLFYGLQLASSNAARLNTAPGIPDVVRTVESSPDGLDLAESGSVIEVYERLELSKPRAAPQSAPHATEAPATEPTPPQASSENDKETPQNIPGQPDVEKIEDTTAEEGSPKETTDAEKPKEAVAETLRLSDAEAKSQPTGAALAAP